MAEIRKDMEENQKDYVRVLDPRAAEISFVRTNCAKREAFYLGCSHLECGRQSVMGTDKPGATLPKLSQNGDWPWHVALFKKGTHVCDGTLVASHWVIFEVLDKCIEVLIPCISAGSDNPRMFPRTNKSNLDSGLWKYQNWNNDTLDSEEKNCKK